MKQLIGKIKATTHQIFGLTDKQRRKTGYIYDNVAVPFNPETDKAYLFNMNADFSLFGREIALDKAFKL